MLTAEIGSAMARAGKAAASQGKKAAAAAAADAYEDNLDLAVDLGWAFLNRESYEVGMPHALPCPWQSKCALSAQVCQSLL